LTSRGEDKPPEGGSEQKAVSPKLAVGRTQRDEKGQNRNGLTSEGGGFQQLSFQYCAERKSRKVFRKKEGGEQVVAINHIWGVTRASKRNEILRPKKGESENHRKAGEAPGKLKRDSKEESQHRKSGKSMGGKESSQQKTQVLEWGQKAFVERGKNVRGPILGKL